MLYDNNDYGKSLIGNNYTNPLSLINAQDIDNIAVLKDATAEYGAKGANGAIIITTSRAKKQATSIDFGVYASYNQQPALAKGHQLIRMVCSSCCSQHMYPLLQ